MRAYVVLIDFGNILYTIRFFFELIKNKEIPTFANAWFKSYGMPKLPNGTSPSKKSSKKDTNFSDISNLMLFYYSFLTDLTHF